MTNTAWAKGNPVPVSDPGSGIVSISDPRFVGATPKDPEMPSGDLGRVFFSV